MQLFLDMDGVLADFDTGYEIEFGIRPDKNADTADWNKVAASVGFYERLPPMPDFAMLWDFAARFNPIVLTGVPWSVEDAPANKRAWAVKHLGPRVEVRCCRSRDKCLHAAPGDVLVDDWEKYRALWVEKGGRWITHTSAENTIAALLETGFGL